MESDLIKMSVAAGIALVIGIIQNVLYRIVLLRLYILQSVSVFYWLIAPSSQHLFETITRIETISRTNKVMNSLPINKETLAWEFWTT